MSVRRAPPAAPVTAAFTPSGGRRLDAVLRIGAAATTEQEPVWLTTAKATLDTEGAKIQKLEATIRRLYRALEKSKSETREKTVELAQAQVRAATCARRRATLAEKLKLQKVEMATFERENKEIVETIEELKSLCQGYVPYEGEPYEEFVA
jgi:chromosome segregation ATPase